MTPKRKPIDHMTSDERAELRRALADYIRDECPICCNSENRDGAIACLATLLAIPKREDGTFEFSQFETKKG